MDRHSISMTINSSFSGEIFPRIGLAVTNFNLPAGKELKVYNGRGDDENRIKEGKNTLRRDKTSCHRFAANQVRLLIGFLAYILQMKCSGDYLPGEEVKRSMERLIKGLIGGRSEGRVSRSEVASSCGFSLSLGHIIKTFTLESSHKSVT